MADTECRIVGRATDAGGRLLLRKIKRLKRPHSGMLFPDGSDSVGGGNAAEIVAELRDTRRSERQGRLIDNDEEAAMERKKREDYF